MAIDATAGGENANSYITAADADAYFATRLNSSTWEDSDAQEEALIHACVLLEQLDYIGIPVTDTLSEDGWHDAPPYQSLKWPRVLDDRGELIRNYAGAKQVETASIVGTVTGDGDATVIVTAEGLTGSPITLNVAVLETDTAAEAATKIRAALNANAAITAFFAVSGSGADVVLTALVEAADDSTMTLAYDNDTCTGLTGDATSADTTPGALYAVPRPIKLAQCEVAIWLLETGAGQGVGSGNESLIGVDLGPIKLKYDASASLSVIDPMGLPGEAARFLKGLRLWPVVA
jgi:hypothetical protein